MVSLSNKVTAPLLTCGDELKVVPSPTLQKDVTDQYTGRKEPLSLTCPQRRVNGLIPSIEITAPDCAHQMLSCITLKRQQLDLYPIPPPASHTTIFLSFCVLHCFCITSDENIICLLSLCLSYTNPKSSKVATFLHRYYVIPPYTFNQERLITRVLDWHLLLPHT